MLWVYQTVRPCHPHTNCDLPSCQSGIHGPEVFLRLAIFRDGINDRDECGSGDFNLRKSIFPKAAFTYANCPSSETVDRMASYLTDEQSNCIREVISHARWNHLLPNVDSEGITLEPLPVTLSTANVPQKEVTVVETWACQVMVCQLSMWRRCDNSGYPAMTITVGGTLIGWSVALGVTAIPFFHFVSFTWGSKK